METLTELYLHNFKRQHDITEHLPYLAGLASGGREVVELGFRTGRSTSAFLHGGAKMVTVYDINPCQDAVGVFVKLAPQRFRFVQGNTLKVSIPRCDVLFIDSYHTGSQLFEELLNHQAQASKFIVMHDTETFGHKGEDGKVGLQDAIRRFKAESKRWEMVVHFPNNNGLTVLERVV